MDPEVEIRPVANQVDDLLAELDGESWEPESRSIWVPEDLKVN